MWMVADGNASITSEAGKFLAERRQLCDLISTRWSPPQPGTTDQAKRIRSNFGSELYVILEFGPMQIRHGKLDTAEQCGWRQTIKLTGESGRGAKQVQGMAEQLDRSPASGPDVTEGIRQVAGRPPIDGAVGKTQ